MQLLCLGDVALANSIPTAWQPPAGLQPGAEARVLFNWEFPIGERVNPVPRSSGRRFLAHPRAVEAVRAWAPGFATLATNHVLDAGVDGLMENTQALRQAGFTTVGAGRTREEAVQPAFWETTAGRLAIVNWVFPETHPDWMALPGPNCWPGLEEAGRVTRELRSQADWVLVVVHWSDELFPYPQPEDRAIARELARMGADLVVGHHPHVVRGMETIGTCPIFYSLGDYYFSDIRDDQGNWLARRAPRNREALALRITFARGRQPTWQALSFWQLESRVVPDRLGRAARRMESTSRPLQRLQGQRYAEWLRLERAYFDRWGSPWHFGVWKAGWRGLARRISGLLHLSVGCPLAVPHGVKRTRLADTTKEMKR